MLKNVVYCTKLYRKYMLSKKAKYALKTLIYLKQNEANCPISAKVIAENQRIPYKFLESILRELRQFKILKSNRGSEGGYSFMKSPSEVSVLEIVRLIDGPVAFVSCVSLNYYEKCAECSNEETCEIRKLFEQVRIAMLPILDKTIDEIAGY